MAIYIFGEMQNGKARRIYASTRYPSRQSGVTFYDADAPLKVTDTTPVDFRGFYSAVSFKPSYVIASRDVIGGKPLYYSHSLTFSSFKWYFDEEPVEIEPGEVLKMDYNGMVIERKKFHFGDVFKLEFSDPAELMEKIERSLLSFKPGHSCLAFSGGVDSSLLAALYDVQLVTVTSSDREEEWVKKVAGELGKSVEVFRFDESYVKDVLPEVISTIETVNPLHIAISIPVYASLEFAKSLGYSSIIFGQGADELFGGYKRYETMDKFQLEDAMLNDVRNLGRDNLTRDCKLAYRKEMRLLLPYLQWDVIEAAINLPAEMKVRKVNGSITRKYALRELASSYLPKDVAYRDKKAMQYSTKTQDILMKFAKREGLKLEEYLRKVRSEG
jgi:asparagine synthase (glutamine-hydrolysing)